MYYILFALLIVFIVSIALYQKYNTIENFDPDHIFDKNVKIENFKGNTNLPIQNYIVKSSYNSSIDHQNYVSKDAIKYVLGRGCRFLDFEILYEQIERYSQNHTKVMQIHIIYIYTYTYIYI